jgi:hypothetical protein
VYSIIGYVLRHPAEVEGFLGEQASSRQAGAIHGSGGDREWPLLARPDPDRAHAGRRWEPSPCFTAELPSAFSAFLQLLRCLETCSSGQSKQRIFLTITQSVQVI